MAKQYRLQPGTSARIYYVLTIMDDGRMMLHFHGTDRSLTDEATLREDGWITTKGAMFPPISCKKWMELDVTEHTGTVPAVSSEAPAERITEGLSPACEVAADVVEVEPVEESNPEPLTLNPEPANDELLSLYERQQQELEHLRQQNARLMAERESMGSSLRSTKSEENLNSKSSGSDELEIPVRRQRRPKRQRIEREVEREDHREPLTLNPEPKCGWLKPLMVAAASIAACVVIYETGMLIPLGLIGMAAGGILK